MKISSISVIAITILLFLSGCCINFSDLSYGNTYNVGDVIYASGKNIYVQEFLWGGNNWTSGGEASIDNKNYAHGSGNDLHTNNVNVNFKLDYPVDKITLNVGWYGGNINIKVNDDLKNVNNLLSLNNMIIGGVKITIDVNQQDHNTFGKMILDGTIKDFSIGGQEFWLDDICTCK